MFELAPAISYNKYEESMTHSRCNVKTAKIAISIDPISLKKLDSFVKQKIFKNRSQAIQSAVNQVIERLEHQRLAQECVKLDVATERELADEGLLEDFKEWPKY